MEKIRPPRRTTSLLVSDFSGARTRHDFYELAIESRIPANMPNYWAQHRSVAIGRIEALRLSFAEIWAKDADALAILQPRVRTNLRRSWTVAFAGGGFPVVEPDGFVSSDLHLASSESAGVFRNENVSFQPLDRRTDIFEMLLHRSP